MRHCVFDCQVSGQKGVTVHGISRSGVMEQAVC